MSTQHASGHQLHVSLGDGLWDALHTLAKSTGESINHIVRRSLAESLDLEHHTIYQVSTSGALVQGVYQGCVSVADLKRYGDFGLGTFDGLDGEGIMLDGTCWQARGDGSVRVAMDRCGWRWIGAGGAGDGAGALLGHHLLRCRLHHNIENSEGLG